MSEQAASGIKGSKSASRLTGFLSLLGLAVASYLAYTYSLDQSPYCAGSGGCESVQTSEFVTIIDGLTVPLLGAFGYIVLIALTMLRGRVNARVDFYLPLIAYGATLVGLFYSAYLTYLEAFVIHAWCYWCLVSAILMVAVFLLSVIDLRRAWFES